METKHLCLNCGTEIDEQFCNAGCRDRFNEKKSNEYRLDNFIYNDNFYSDISDLIDEMESDGIDINELPEDYKIVCFNTETQPIEQFDAGWILERMDEERWPEDDDGRFYEKVRKIFNECIDFEKLNSMMPELHYPASSKFFITKNDLIENL